MSGTRLVARMAAVMMVAVLTAGFVVGGASPASADTGKPASVAVGTKRIVKTEAAPGNTVNVGAFENWTVGIRDTNGAWVEFRRGSGGDVIHRWQLCAGCSWSGWVSLGGQILGSPDVEIFPDGRLVVFATFTDRQLWHKWQPCDGCAWSGWHSLGGGLASNPSVVLKSNNVLVAFAVATIGNLWHTWQLCVGCGWSAWTSLEGGFFTSSPAAGRFSDDSLYAFVMLGDTRRYIQQQCNECEWGKWQDA